MPELIAQAKRRAALLCVVVALLASALGYLVLWGGGEPRQLHLHELGLLFTATVVATRSIAHRAKDLTTVALALAGASFGFWMPPIVDVFTSVTGGWVETEVVGEATAAAIVYPLAIASAGLLSAALLFVACGSDRVFGKVALLSVAVAGAALLPAEQVITLTGAAIVWQVGVSVILGGWAVEATALAANSRCPVCRADLTGVTSPVCPSCKAKLAGAGPLHTLSAAFAQPGPEARAADQEPETSSPVPGRRAA
ncbi:MAG: hypothetical protein AAGG07_03810 [Planctomycetota bacterium]